MNGPLTTNYHWKLLEMISSVLSCCHLRKRMWQALLQLILYNLVARCLFGWTDENVTLFTPAICSLNEEMNYDICYQAWTSCWHKKWFVYFRHALHNVGTSKFLLTQIWSENHYEWKSVISPFYVDHGRCSANFDRHMCYSGFVM